MLTTEQAAAFRNTLSFALGEVSCIKSSIDHGEMVCEAVYAQLVNNAFETLRELVEATHASFCEEDS